jgi:hypothetical protein
LDDPAVNEDGAEDGDDDDAEEEEEEEEEEELPMEDSVRDLSLCCSISTILDILFRSMNGILGHSAHAGHTGGTTWFFRMYLSSEFSGISLLETPAGNAELSAVR